MINQEALNLIKDEERTALNPGDIYGGLEVVNYAGYITKEKKDKNKFKYKAKIHYWNMKCLKCGNIIPVREWTIKTCRNNSCGCQQLSKLENMQNMRIVEWNGNKYSVSELCHHFGIDSKMVFDRMTQTKGNMPLDEAVLTPKFSHVKGKSPHDMKDDIIKNGPYLYKPNAINPLICTKYPEIDMNDPKLFNRTIDELANDRGLVPALQESEEEYKRAREIAKQNLIEKIRNQKIEEDK